MRRYRQNSKEVLRYRRALGWVLGLAEEYFNSEAQDPMLVGDTLDKLDTLRAMLCRIRRGEIVF